MTEGHRRTCLSAASRLRTQLRSAIAVGVSGFATRARRRAARSEKARGAQAREELEQVAAEQAALGRVATLVAEAVPPGEVFTAVAAEVAGLFDVPLVGLFRYETDRAATLVAGAGKGSAYLGRRWSFAADDQSVVGSLLKTGRPLRIDDYAPVRGAVTDEARELGIGAAAGVPVIVSGRVWGAVVLAAGHDRPPLPADTLDRLAAFTDLVATAIANSDAQTEIERLAEEQAALRRVATLVARQPSPEEVFAAVTEEAGKLLHLDTAHLLVYNGDGTATAVGAWGVRAAQLPAGQRVPLEGDNIIVRVSRTQQPVRIDDYASAGGPAAERARLVGVRAAVGTPIVVEGRLWGVMAVGSSRPEPLPAGTEFRLGAFTELVATAIANAEARTEIERLAEEQAALRRVATLVARGTAPEEVFAAVAEEVGRVLTAEVTCVVRFEADATGTVLATWGDASFWPIGSNFGLEGVAARVYRTRRPARMDGYGKAPGELTEMARRIGGRSRVGAPVIIDDRLWGAALAVNFASGGALPAAAEERMANFADLITTAISNAEARTELTASRARVVTAADNARRQLERDLHDGIQQRLVSLAVKARTIGTTTPRTAGAMQGELSLLADGLQAALDELREISHGIHPAILSEAGLGPALKTLARRSAVPVALELNLGSRLDEHLEAAAYYVASEALTNATKHAQASVVDMRVDGRGGGLTLSIRDDGIGGADPRRGSGIIGLKDRVEALGGTISVLSPSGRGTTLHVEFPGQRRT